MRGDYYNIIFGFVDGLGDQVIAAVSAVLLVASLVGCVGAVRENHLMIKTYVICQSVFLLSQVIVGIYLYSIKLEETRNEMTVKFHDYLVESRSHYEVDEIQRDLHCCGVDGPSYWIGRNVTALPHSCCYDQSGPRRVAVFSGCNETDAWQVGCFKKSLDVFRFNLYSTMMTAGSVNVRLTTLATYQLDNVKRAASWVQDRIPF